jgi:hypothetical protein
MATPAAGQASGLAVGASVLGGNDSRDDRLPSQFLGGGVDVVTFLSPRFSVGLEIDVPRTRAYGGTFRTPHADGSADVSFVQNTFRGTTIAAVVGRHFVWDGRVNVSLVAGLASERRSFGQSGYHDTIDASGVIVTHQTFDISGGPNVFTWLQVPLGFDAEIALRPHLSLVPQLRFYFDPLAFMNDGCCDGTQGRARVAIRWRF